VPVPHVLHSTLPCCLADRPGGQYLHARLEEFSVKWLTAQSLQALLFFSSWYFPGTHGRQAAWPLTSW